MSALIVDDHPSFRTSARRMLEAAGYDVVGEAEDGREALAAVERLRPDIVLLDVRLPDLDGFEVTKLMLAAHGPDPEIVLVSSHDSADLEETAVASGARGFVPKSELSSEAIDLLLA